MLYLTPKFLYIFVLPEDGQVGRNVMNKK